ncbi:YagK/YfjJ domain-containing protein [Vogesella indigofera]|uniref:YagK/YfjJ domain-containing protein n=1 Tax=Vogesella indigofera TaxID=45465 RepID=UPI00234F91B0|nr:inovirus-type Gp2 protein [Vogesella indigofera]MDC7697645.1 inovirus-type Gp2 protein [Vogesella indigofera]
MEFMSNIEPPNTLALGANSLIHSLHQNYRQLMIVRVDLLMREEYQIMASIFDIHEYRTRLWNNRRSKPSIFEHCLGWIWGLEWTKECGYHLHCLFAFNGREVQQDIWYGNQIGNYWINVITKGKGCYRNCNQYKDSYQHLGIGKVHINDQEKLANLLQYVIPYLAKDDQLIRKAIHTDGLALGRNVQHIRTFGYSNNLSL